MNKSFSIHLGGSIFHIEEDAYLQLKAYLDTIKHNLNGDPGTDEIMQDIEARIGEIFQSKMDERKSVILLRDVEDVIATMGKPEDYTMGESKAEDYTEPLRNKARRVYRDQDDALVGGVCSGLSHYFGWDPVILRLLAVALFFISGGGAFIGYLIFWGVVPAAQTTAEKLQMRGEPVNIDNIRKFVNDEAKQAAENINRFARNAGSNKRKGSESMYQFANILKRIFGLMSLLFGLGLGILLVVSLVAADLQIFGSHSYQELQNLIMPDENTLWLITIGAILAIGAPAVACIYNGIRLLVGNQRKLRGLSITLSILFVAGIAMAIAGGINIGTEFKSEAQIPTTIILDNITNDTLYIDVPEDSIFRGVVNNRHHDPFELLSFNGQRVHVGSGVSLIFETSDATSDYKVKVVKCSQGRNVGQASELADRIEYNYAIQNNHVMLPFVYDFPQGDKFRGQFVDITVIVPAGKYVHFGPDIHKIYWKEKFANRTERRIEGGWESEQDSEEETREKFHIEYNRGEWDMERRH